MLHEICDKIFYVFKVFYVFKIFYVFRILSTKLDYCEYFLRKMRVQDLQNTSAFKISLEVSFSEYICNSEYN